MNLEVITRQPCTPAHPTPLLFIHGAYHGAWCWENFQAYFARQGYASHAVNLRGHGRSSGRERLRWAGARDFVDDMVQVARPLPAPPVLIGHSMGGYLVQKYLERHAAPAAVLLATMPAAGGVRIFNRMLRHRPWRTINMHLTLRPFLQVETPELARELLFSSDLSADQADRYCSMLQSESYRIGWDMSFLDVCRPARTQKTPMLFLGGEKDRLILSGEVAETAAVYGARAEFFDTAHDMMLESGWEGVAQRILDWLREQKL